MATASKQTSKWVPKPAITPRHLSLRQGFLPSVLSFSLCPLQFVICSWACAGPHLLWFTPFSLCGTHPVSMNQSFIGFSYVMNQGLPGERRKCNILKIILLLKVTCTGLDASGIRGDLGQRKNSHILSILVPWKTVWPKARIVVAWEARFLTTPHSPAF